MGDHDLDHVRFPRRITDAAAARPSHAEPPVVGKSSATQSLPSAATQPVAGSNGIYASPGSMWNTDKLLPPEPVITGVPLADRGLGCLPVGGAPAVGPCFLDPVQRQFILGCYQHNVGVAHAQYLNAVSSVRVEQILEKDPDQSNLLLELFLDVITLAIGASVRTVLRRLMGGTEDISAVISDQQRVINELSAVTEAGIMAVLGGAATKGREKAKEQSGDARGQAEKAARLSLLDLLTREAALRYHELSVRSPAGASDAQLLVMYRAFEPSNGHTSPDYAHHLRGKLDRFRKGELSRIGVQPNRNHLRVITGGGSADPESHWEIATQAFWVNTPIGRRLALYRRGHEPSPTRVPAATGIGREASVEERQTFERASLQHRPFQFYKYVSDEFVQAALQMHAARWGSQPAEHAFGVAEYKALGLVM